MRWPASRHLQGKGSARKAGSAARTKRGRRSTEGTRTTVAVLVRSRRASALAPVVGSRGDESRQDLAGGGEEKERGSARSRPDGAARARQTHEAFSNPRPSRDTGCVSCESRCARALQDWGKDGTSAARQVDRRRRRHQARPYTSSLILDEDVRGMVDMTTTGDDGEHLALD